MPPKQLLRRIHRQMLPEIQYYSMKGDHTAKHNTGVCNGIWTDLQTCMRFGHVR